MRHINFISNIIKSILFPGNLTYGYDVALIFLKEDAILNDNVQLASLPQSNQDCPPGNSLTLSGWGTDPTIPRCPPHCTPHNALWAVKQECLDIEECDRFGSLTDKNIILCVGDKTNPRNSGFKGDSGGKFKMRYLSVEISSCICKVFFFNIAMITFIRKPTLGPLTFSDDSGERTIFGIVSGPGDIPFWPIETTAFARVSHPKYLIG